MIRRGLGRTGIEIPAVGLGTWRYHAGVEPLQAGIALGACFIDTAESYGTEEVVGRAIEGVRQSIFLATKVAPRHFKYSEVINSANHSLKRLRTDYLDLYQLHWPNYTVPIEETMAAMEELADRGKIRFIGVSNFMLRDLRRAQKAMTKHEIVSNQVRYNLIDRTIEDGLLKHCQEHAITVIAHSPLASSLASIAARDAEDTLKKLAQVKSASVAQIALSWCLSKPGVVVIPKASSVEHVRENCAVCDLHLSPSELQILGAKVRPQRRGALEIALRRIARHGLQIAGRNQ